MDFTLGEELEAVRDLARQILTDHATPERVRAAEETGVDEPLWKELAAAGLLGVALPESAGGAGLGVSGLCVLLEEQGRTVAPVPIWPALVAGLTLAEHGTCPPEVADGTLRYTLALEEFGPHDPAEPRCEAVGTDARGGSPGRRPSSPRRPSRRRCSCPRRPRTAPRCSPSTPARPARPGSRRAPPRTTSRAPSPSTARPPSTSAAPPCAPRCGSRGSRCRPSSSASPKAPCG
ncbi:acyl-CoA dehydrogenase family protein [Actinomadura sp. CNU-125]|uniref:acyl-CoA dehydrogenase family protein n=1 Tax=Actinomadura sp. CNU-125 TaxID=1904961 RepID=UPI0021CC9E20|nr:acyl-CoA dehydrogenase family protein [Actinomadura sp. CNU-125]